MSRLAVAGQPFLFLIDYELKNPLVCPVDKAQALGFYFNLKGASNTASNKALHTAPQLKVCPVKKSTYANAYQQVNREIVAGNTFLLNLTFPSKIKTTASLEEVFYAAKAPYKLYCKDQFVVYSPECFVKIKGNSIYAYPMKGTIDARLPQAAQTLLNNPKEIQEHNTIVDLLRNDLSLVAKKVHVRRFRYLEKIKTPKKELLQTSSEIQGTLPQDWKKQLPDILLSMLPAGSICGAPKQETLRIIQQVESEARGYYTGVFGYYDGATLDSAVSIRFLEKKNGQLRYRSRGGITFLSQLDTEYNELIDKIYVPVL